MWKFSALICSTLLLLGVSLIESAAVIDIAPAAQEASVATEEIVAFEQPEVHVEIVSSDSVKKILAKYPNAVELKRVTQKQLQITGRATYLNSYYLGSRVKGDRRVAYDEKNYILFEEYDVSMRIEYPKTGTGAIVTFVEIDVYQTSTDGRAYVVAGGIGQRLIHFIIEAQNTRLFQSEVSIYGRD